MDKIISPLRHRMQGQAVANLQDVLKQCLDRSASACRRPAGPR